MKMSECMEQGIEFVACQPCSPEGVKALENLRKVHRYLNGCRTRAAGAKMDDLKTCNDRQRRMLADGAKAKREMAAELNHYKAVAEGAKAACAFLRNEKDELQLEIANLNSQLKDEQTLRNLPYIQTYEGVEVGELVASLRSKIANTDRRLQKVRDYRQDIKFMLDGKKQQIRALQQQVFDLENK